ncbi:glutaredoxin domain-containing protein [Paracoccus sp. IB05]|uniref:glutaredoxin domain-containing protein n=1 Tax=Paracoccus sp. IB05 TaxID=2779367 RepID=UPI0018E86A1B|nr:glutaredoxin domain-containing protein [Paracoccus sp. IB05]MBJ2151665.1 NrdH-redoxin [Paracoccus sp. IB05]
MITLDTKPVRVQCDIIKCALDQAGIQYRVIDLTKDAEAMAYVQSLGYRQAPVVVIDDGQHWAGYQPGKIAALR